MDIEKILGEIIEELIESDISAYDFKVVNAIIDKVRKEHRPLKG